MGRWKEEREWQIERETFTQIRAIVENEFRNINISGTAARGKKNDIRLWWER